MIVTQSHAYVFNAPNLTKLVYYCNNTLYYDDTPLAKRFPRLQTLMLDRLSTTVDLSGLMELRKLVLSYCWSEVMMDLSPLINLKMLHLVDPRPNSVKNIPESVEVLRITLSDDNRGGSITTELADLNITRFECLLSLYLKPDAAKTILPNYFQELIKCSTLQHLKVECDDKIILPLYAKFTQLKTLDLVQSSNTQNNILSSQKPATHEDIIELSKQLPNTKIYFGYNLPTTIQRPKEDHWYDDKLEQSGLEPFDCGCEYCKAYERGFYEEEFDSTRSAICIDPKPFKAHWSWY
eukprot:TRINITY_DN1203_c0_g3_i1.p1 TRINITY_DN1203_c0_g3~~TRINITY_DN1203_c0_g3_i1.p1  ORF type:complete len:294 (-),score=22.37 TRINITY_DN1203_c0_g3_i1:59-940(-)